MSDSELTLEQWKAKFKNANMDKAEAIFRERKAQAENEKLKKQEDMLNRSLDDKVKHIEYLTKAKEFFIKRCEALEEIEIENAQLKEKLGIAVEALEFCAQNDLFDSNGEFDEWFKYKYDKWFGDVAKETLEKLR